MTGYIKVEVRTETDDSGNISPIGIIWEGKLYNIVRVIHVSQPDDRVTAYTILIGNRHRKLLFNGSEWRVSSLPVYGGKGEK